MVSHLRARTANGDASDAEVCEDDPGFLCLEGDDDDDEEFLTDRNGDPIPDFPERWTLCAAQQDRDQHDRLRRRGAGDARDARQQAARRLHLRRRAHRLLGQFRDRRAHGRARLRGTRHRHRPGRRRHRPGACEQPQRLCRLLCRGDVDAVRSADRHRLGALQHQPHRAARPDRQRAERPSRIQPPQPRRRAAYALAPWITAYAGYAEANPRADAGGVLLRRSASAVQPDPTSSSPIPT